MAALSVGACKDPAPAEGTQVFEPARVETPAPEPPPTPAGAFARSFVELLDLVPPDADGYLIVRDLRPLIAEARVLEQVMAGPLRSAIPALAALGGGSGDARLAQLEYMRELLGLGLAGIEGAGIELQLGLVVAFTDAKPTVLFSAESLESLLTLASFVDTKLDLRRSCKAVSEARGWYACSLAGEEAVERYAPAGQGEILHARLAQRFAGVDLDGANLAVSLADSERPVDLLLHTQPELWELSVPLPPALTGTVLSAGAPMTLARLIPGSSFVWAKLDAQIAGRGLGLAELGPVAKLGELLSGELWFGATDAPNGMLLRLGLSDEAGAATGVEAMAKLLPDGPLRPEGVAGLELEFDRAWLELAGQPTPSIGVRAKGETAEDWAASLGLDARGRLWVGSGALNLGLGEVQSIPQALAAEAPTDASAALAALPRSLAQSLEAKQVGFALHLTLDDWQAPLREHELDGLLAGFGGIAGPAGAQSGEVAALFEALAPWSSVTLWLARTPGQPWILRTSVVPFASSSDPGEARAARELLDAILGGAEGAPGYRALNERFPDSPRAASYRARLGEAPSHHAAVGMTELALFAAVVLPVLESALAKPQRSEAPAMTQSLLGAVLQAREQAGSCRSLVGSAGPTPPLTLSCADGEDGRCWPQADPQPDLPLGEGRYPLALWTADPLWRAIDYAPRPGTGHRAHYSLEVSESKGSCHIVVEGQTGPTDGQLSTMHRREATVDKSGATTLSPLQIEEMH